MGNQKLKRQNSLSVNGVTVSSRAQGDVAKTRGAGSRTVKRAVRNVRRELDKTNDSSLQSVSKGVDLANAGVQTFRAAQKAEPVMEQAAKGVYHAAGKTVRVVKQIDSTIAKIQTGAIVLDKNTVARMASCAKNRIMDSAPVAALHNAAEGVYRAGKGVYNIADKTVKVVKRVDSTVTMLRSGIIVLDKNTAAQLASCAKNRIIGAAPAVARGMKVGLTAGAKGVVFTTGSIHIGKGINQGLRLTGNALINTGNDGAQAAGLALKGIHYTAKGAAYVPKVAKAAYKGTRGVIRTGSVVAKGTVKTYHGVKIGLKIYKKAGISKATRMYARRWSKSLAGKLAKAGRSAATAAVNLLKLLGKKLLIPLALVLVVVFCGSSILNAVAGLVASILSPFISDDTGNVIDETQLITQEVTSKRADLINELKETYHDNLVENGGNYHFIRFFNAFNDTEIEFTDTNISTSIYSIKDYVEAIQPVFHTLIICEYDGEASESQMKSLITEMWNLLNVIQTEELPTEYCSMDVGEDGAVTPIPDTDGFVHADPAVCPNHSGDVLFHPDADDGRLAACDRWYFLCDGHRGSCTHHCNNDCDYDYRCGGISLSHLFHNESCKRYYCGHSHSPWNSAASPGCYSTNYCNGGGSMATRCSNGSRHKSCTGYYECFGHRILALSISVNSFGDLLKEYILDEMDVLKAKTSRTIEEEQRLGELQDYYEICLAYLTVLEEEYGYGTGAEIVGLDGVDLTALTEFACSFVGNPYIWGGNDPNTGADCSGFVKYVFANFGVTMNRTAHEQVRQGILVDGIANAQPGDLIFWSEDGTDAGVYHVAIYLGNNKIVHASNSRPYPAGGIKVGNVYGAIYKIKRML